MRKGLRSSRKVTQMALRLGVIQAAAAGGIAFVWSFADDEADDEGFMPDTDPAVVDVIAGIDGFADAMISVGWLVVRDGGLEFPEFDKYLGAKHRSRAANARRARKYRAKKKAADNGKRHGSVTRDGGVTRHDHVTSATHKTETKTSVKSGAPNPSGSTHRDARGGASDSPAPEPVKKSSSAWRSDLEAIEFSALRHHPGFEEAWTDWLAYRRESKLKLPVQRTYKATWRKAKADPAALVASIRQSIEQGWQGLFPERLPQSAPAALHGHSGKMNAADAAAVWRAQRAAQGAPESQPRDVDLEPDSPFRLLGGAKQ